LYGKPTYHENIYTQKDRSFQSNVGLFHKKRLFSKRLLLLRFVTLKTAVDYNGRCETPVGIAGRLRPRKLAKEAQLTPHGKGAS
jgi:hypothetical protein